MHGVVGEVAAEFGLDLRRGQGPVRRPEGGEDLALTLSIHSVDTTRRESFYWLAVLFTFALGTAAGDLVSERMNLGYWLAAVLFALAIGAIAVAHFALGLDAVWSFWIAYILTRPLGASIGDYLSQPTGDGGLGLGTVVTSVLFLSVILGLVVYLAVTRRDVIEPELAAGWEELSDNAKRHSGPSSATSMRTPLAAG